jgi:hypothetical protein
VAWATNTGPRVSLGIEQVDPTRNRVRVVVDPDPPLEPGKARDALRGTEQMLGLLGVVLPTLASVVDGQLSEAERAVERC